jgi:hypothetical protein
METRSKGLLESRSPDNIVVPSPPVLGGSSGSILGNTVSWQINSCQKTASSSLVRKTEKWKDLTTTVGLKGRRG